tara:strand:- start:730 stop:1344 length:615 start_codon:yes stop_codon:yes gene_type:complete
MPRKVLKIIAITSGLITASMSNSFAAAMPQSSQAGKVQVYGGYAYTHQAYKNAWTNSYRTFTGSSPVNDFSGVTFGMNYMMNDWLALDVAWTHYFRKGAAGLDGRLSGLKVGAMAFKNINPKADLIGTAGASVGAFTHNGDGGVGTANPSFTDTDVSLYLGAGFQYKVSDMFSVRPMLNLMPLHDRADTNYSYGGSISLVMNLG